MNINIKTLRMRYFTLLKPRLRVVDIYRPQKNNYGEPTGETEKVCSVYGYLYSKYLQVVRTVMTGGDISKESNERLLILPIDKDGGPTGDFPEILAGDKFAFEGRDFRVNYVQENANVSRTLIAEREYGHVE